MAKKDKKFDSTTEAAPAVEGATPEVETKAKAPKLGYHVTLNGAGYVFAKRDPLKKAHAVTPATIGGVEGSVTIISAREFSDNRVWVTLPNGDTGRFLVPKTVDLTGPLVIDVVEGSIEYKREDLRVRPKVERAKKAAPAAEPATEPTPEATA
jgi:hypothetical protein